MGSVHASQLRVLHVAPTFYPATRWGGPTFSTKALCDGLARRPEVRLRVLTTDAAGPASGERLSLASNPAWFESGYEVQYARRVAGASVSPELLMRLPGAIRWADVVHLTATYSFPTLPVLGLARLFGKPVIWSPRGALQATEQWAGAPRRRLKHGFERACQILRPEETVLHVTAAMEAELSCARLSGIRTIRIPNIIDVPKHLPPRQWRPAGRLRVMYISRLHPKKGIEHLLAAVHRRPNHVTLDVYGSGSRDYQDTLRQKIKALRLGDRVQFHGHVDGAAKTRAFLEADVMCLPSHTENFGIVVGEALAHGVPVVTTTGTPWDGLEVERCGLWISPREASLIDALNRLEHLDLAAMGKRGRTWTMNAFSSDAVVTQMVETYRDVLSECSRHSDVRRGMTR